MGVWQRRSLGDRGYDKFIRKEVALLSLLREQDVLWMSTCRKLNICDNQLLLFFCLKCLLTRMLDSVQS